jgi:hypothetical protein
MSEQIGIRLNEEVLAALKQKAELKQTTFTKLIQEVMTKYALDQADDGPNTDTTKLLRHTIYMLERVHEALYLMPERQGIVTTESLQSIYDQTLKGGRDYLAKLDKHVAKALGKSAEGDQ